MNDKFQPIEEESEAPFSIANDSCISPEPTLQTQTSQVTVQTRQTSTYQNLINLGSNLGTGIMSKLFTTAEAEQGNIPDWLIS